MWSLWATTRSMPGRNGTTKQQQERTLCTRPHHPPCLCSSCLPRSQLGNTWRATGNVNRAIQCFRKALSIKPTDPDVLLNMAVVLQNLRYLGDAEILMREAVQLHNNGVLHHFILGNILQLQGRVEEAVASYEYALQLQPNFVYVSWPAVQCSHLSKSNSLLPPLPSLPSVADHARRSWRSCSLIAWTTMVAMETLMGAGDRWCADGLAMSCCASPRGAQSGAGVPRLRHSPSNAPRSTEMVVAAAVVVASTREEGVVAASVKGERGSSLCRVAFQSPNQRLYTEKKVCSVFSRSCSSSFTPSKPLQPPTANRPFANATRTCFWSVILLVSVTAAWYLRAQAHEQTTDTRNILDSATRCTKPTPRFVQVGKVGDSSVEHGQVREASQVAQRVCTGGQDIQIPVTRTMWSVSQSHNIHRHHPLPTYALHMLLVPGVTAVSSIASLAQRAWSRQPFMPDSWPPLGTSAAVKAQESVASTATPATSTMAVRVGPS